MIQDTNFSIQTSASRLQRPGFSVQASAPRLQDPAGDVLAGSIYPGVFYWLTLDASYKVSLLLGKGSPISIARRHVGRTLRRWPGLKENRESPGC
jgi:hypothetical protein